MNHIDFTNAGIDALVTHNVGNKLQDDGMVLSDKGSTLAGETVDYVLRYFLSAFKPVEFKQFDHPVSLDLNEVFMMVNGIFKDKSDIISSSKNLARLLYEHSTHPNIKTGEFNVVLFNNIGFNDEVVDAVGLFKSESNIPFIQMNIEDNHYRIDHDFGFDLKGIDKACIIFNTNAEQGYSILVKDNTNKSQDAQYWADKYLRLKSCNDNYNSTKDFMHITKNFLTRQLPDEFEVSKTEKIDLLNKTVDYFKTNESFDKSEFEENVLKDKEVIDSFRAFNETYSRENNIRYNDSFGISAQAVKKQSRIFKSILKLDKNFHVYIHGGKNMIEKGVELDGRKYYKIYYENEN